MEAAKPRPATERLLAELLRVQGKPLAQAAVLLASAGWPIYPCKPGGKAPLTTHGLLDATTDATKVARWWAHWPEANIATPTGRRSGFEVVDVDVHENHDGYSAFHRAAKRFGLDRWVARVTTPSGGMHYYYPVDFAAKVQRNWTCAIAAIDFRGSGGGIILPPSVGNCCGDIHQPYTLIQARHGGAPINATALRAFLDPVQARRALQTHINQELDPVPTLPTRLANYVATREEGERNSTLFWAACRMVEAGFDKQQTWADLAPAATHVGLEGPEIAATIDSAYKHTIAKPVPSSEPVVMGVQVITR